MLSANPAAMHLLEANPNKIDWETFSSNAAAIKYLEKHPDKIDWCWLSYNPNAFKILESQLHPKINWEWICSNPSCVTLLKTHRNEIDPRLFSENLGIFEYDYQAMSRPFTEELMQNRFHPDNIGKFEAWGYE